MQFELDKIMIDSILFFMEDQNDTFVIDTQTTEVVSLDEIDGDDDDTERYINLPEWDSSNGFKLMERFAVSFKNPPIKKALTKALDQGKGVFRAFKNVLTDHPEAEKLWYAFKEQEMRKHITRWYNSLREKWGLEKIGDEPEETDDLILEDFRIRLPIDTDKDEARKLHQFCLEESRKIIFEKIDEETFPEDPRFWDFPNDISWIAENNEGEFSAYILAKKEGTRIRIIALEVLPEYRGMGIGEVLLNHFVDNIDTEQYSRILIDVPINSESFSKVLFRKDFSPYETRYVLNF
ncbi:MAG: GNAT family N-acetyltransferase [Treponema sp.]|jgi:ribosomal protein S18 acetylase RimI-like enzyme|nr:GNAT family N-acetyltransferase [Treponema sp.]